jgi:hypothetical protein
MKRCWGLLSLLALSCVPAMAQDLTKYEFDAAYEFRSYNVPYTSRLSLNGWGATINRTWTPRVSIIGDFTGTYRFQGSNGDTSLYSFAGGPRVYPFRHPKLALYVQGVFGGAYLRTSFPAQNGFLASSVSSLSFSYSVGGGLEVKIKPRISIRLVEGDYEQTRFTSNYTSNTSTTTTVPHQNNYRISAGVIFRFGEK